MRTYVKAWTVVSTFIVASTFMMSLAATVSAAPGQRGRPDPQAYLVKDIDSTFDTGAGS